MRFFTLLFKNVLRHKARSVLTILGISIGISTIISLGLMTAGLNKMMSNMLTAGDYDFTVTKAGSADVMLSFIDEGKQEKLNALDGIDQSSGMLMSIIQSKETPFLMVYGINSKDYGLSGVTMTEGRAPSDGAEDEVVVGKVGKDLLKTSVGSDIELNKKTYHVVGVFETGIAYEDGGVVLPLSVLQKDQQQDGKVSMFMVKVDQGVNVREAADRVEQAFDGDLLSIVDISDFDSADQGQKMTQAFTWGISLLAIVIGGIGVMNTIIMSVFERTREIGILRALGWGRFRIMGMILGESLLMGLVAAGVGIGMGLGGVFAIMQSDIVKSFLTIEYDPVVFAQAVGVALAVALVGGLYPAYRASRLSPLEALRYE